jgi:hypothetical protein
MEGNTVGSQRRISTDNMFAYIAGFLDADGYITIKIEKSKTCHLGLRGRVRVGFAQNRSRRFVLDTLAKFVKSGVVSEYDHNNMAEYVINNQKVIFDLLTNLEPFVLVKKKQLRLAKKFILLKNVGYTINSLGLMKDLEAKMSKLNSYPKLFDPVTTEI